VRAAGNAIGRAGGFHGALPTGVGSASLDDDTDEREAQTATGRPADDDDCGDDRARPAGDGRGGRELRDPHQGLLDADALERALIQAAREGRTVSYRQLLAMGGRRVGPNNVRALMRVLAEVCRRVEARGEPDLACLVVRESDGLPGEGYFSAEAERGFVQRGGRRERVRAAQAAAFAFWQEEFDR